MRGSAILLFVWFLLLGALFSVHFLMTGGAIGDALDSVAFGFAVGLTLVAGAASVAGNRETLRRGPPGPRPGPESVATASLGAMLVGLSVATVGFGLVFGSFLVFIGAGLFLASAGLMALEVVQERGARRAAERVTRR